MTIDNLPAPKRALIPTALPLAPQDIHPDELKVILGEAAERHAEAEAALAAAQDHFDAAERQREYALSEEQKRLALEEEAHVNDLRRVLPQTEDDADHQRRLFREACAEEPMDLSRVLESFLYWGRYRETATRMRQAILLHDSQQSREDFELWIRRVAGWGELIRSVTSWRKGGVLPGEDDDLDGLAAVNVRINQESQEAPRPLNRDAADLSTPYVEDLGLRDPQIAAIDTVFVQPTHALNFGEVFSEAVDSAAKDWARDALSSIKAQHAKGAS